MSAPAHEKTSDEPNVRPRVSRFIGALPDLRHRPSVTATRDATIRLVKIAVAFGGAASALVGVWEAYKTIRTDFLGAGEAAHVSTQAPVRGPSASATATIPALSFVVLPFTSRAGPGVDDHLADAITDGLTTDLSRLQGSFVISRNTAFTYQGRAVDVRQVGQELGVRYAVEGSILRTSDRLRVTAHLTEVESGRQIWADSFDRDLADYLTLTSEVSGRLSRLLGAQTLEAERRRIERQQSSDPSAIDLALQGWALLHRPISRDRYRQAEDLFGRALSVQADNLLALNGLAWIQAAGLGQAWWDDRAAAARKAEDLLKRVFDIDPQNPVGSFVQCWVLRQTDRALQSIPLCESAAASNPNWATAHFGLSVAYLLAGDQAGALRKIDEAVRLSPRDPMLDQIYYVRASALFGLGRDAEALADYERSRSLNMNSEQVAVCLAALYALLGRQGEAEAVARDVLARWPTATVTRWRRIFASRSTNPVWLRSRERLYEGMRLAGLPEA